MTTSAKPAKAAKAIPPAKDPATSPETLLTLLGQDSATDRLLAKHPKASPQLLEKLSHSSDKTVRNNVALNANTDKAVLLKLAPQFPGDFFKNPAFDWLLLEDPDLLTNLGGGVLKNILKLPDCPVSFMRWAAERGSEQERLAVVMNAVTPTDVLGILALQTGEIGLAASGRAGISTDLAKSVTEIDIDETFSTALCRRLASIGDDDAVSAWSKALIGPGQWTHLSFTARMKTLGFSLVAILPKLLPEFAAVLAKDPNAEVRAFVALDSQTPEQVVQELANDIDPNVRAAALGRAVASTTETTTVSEVLPDDWERILTKGNSAEKLALASHPLAPPHALEQISKKANATMFKALAFNPSCPAPVRLAACHAVADAAGPKILEGMAVDQKAPVQLRLRACERIWWGQFDKFVWSIKDSRRRKIHRTYGDLKNVFIKPQGEQLGQLHGRCCEKLLTDPAASLMAEFLEADQTAVESFSSTMISAGCVSSLVAVRMLALMHRNAPPDDLAKAAKAVEWEVRHAVGRNAFAPRHVLIRLAGDADRRVTAQVKKTLKLQEEMVLAQNERIRNFTGPVDLTAIVQELIQRISKPRSDFDKSLFLPWYLDDSVWWDFMPFSIRLGTTRFVNPFHFLLPKFSEAVLEKLAQHTDSGVRRFVARNPGASVSLLSRLGGDKDASVQFSTGMNPLSPENIQSKMAKKLAKDGISSSRRMGFRNLIEEDPTLATEFLHVYARTVGGYRTSDIASNHGLSEAD